MLCPVFLPHLGCDTKCIYCDQISITDIREFNIEKIIEKSLSNHQTFEVGLFGGNIFGIQPSLLKKIFSLFEDYREHITGFRISTKPVPLKKEVIEILKENNVKVIELGIPVFNDILLTKLSRGYTVTDFYKAYHLLKKEGFHVAMQVMVGLPDEERCDIANTVEHIKSLIPAYIRIYPLVILKDTPIYDAFIKGDFVPCDFHEAVQRSLYIYLNCLSLNIPVVKMGLTDNEVIKEKIAGGFFHPAFGSIVKSEGFYLAIMASFLRCGVKGHIKVKVNKKDVPHLMGYKRKNIQRWAERKIYIEKEIEEMG
ncbi:MAG: radical SAM protein, partial [Syntrophorhabdaceae bacterium]|nr:radical SAM protein [Syntrophorhabdaceae bacterium]